MIEQKELLRDFFSAYFNQDWMLDAASTEEVVEDYSKHHTVEERLALSKAILSFSQALLSDVELERKLNRELDCSYVPTLDGLSAETWLQSVASQLRGA